MYEFVEPDFEQSISNVTLIKVGGQRSEQELSVDVTFSAPLSATPVATPSMADAGESYDYRVSATPGVMSVGLIFPNDRQSIFVPFFLNGDTEQEGLEAFQAPVRTSLCF